MAAERKDTSTAQRLGLVLQQGAFVGFGNKLSTDRAESVADAYVRSFQEIADAIQDQWSHLPGQRPPQFRLGSSVSSWRYVRRNILLVSILRGHVRWERLSFQIRTTIALCLSGLSTKLWVTLTPHEMEEPRSQSQASAVLSSATRLAGPALEAVCDYCLKIDGHKQPFRRRFMVDIRSLSSNDACVAHVLWGVILEGRPVRDALSRDNTVRGLFDALLRKEESIMRLVGENRRRFWFATQVGVTSDDRDQLAQPALFVARSCPSGLSFTGVGYGAPDPIRTAGAAVKEVATWLGARH